jgi:hypothetical protein
MRYKPALMLSVTITNTREVRAGPAQRVSSRTIAASARRRCGHPAGAAELSPPTRLDPLPPVVSGRFGASASYEPDGYQAHSVRAIGPLIA